ncbi:PIG-L family deacetylase [Bacillus massilinigeriensis]|uniref:PIG-L family deacetylase n=1 Tax=Bacillus mediterraneensis TaxID=1805474 RepID=UPI0008F7FEB6|nr:PIG-L family deacetylase [Bacillus mediterraneensis]
MADKLMVVAHPDDELLFGGGELIKETGWKVICVTNGENAQRAKEFHHVMDKVKAEYEIWDFIDEWNGDFDRNLLSQKLKQVLEGNNYRKIVTHNLKGEYGHTQHIALSQILHGLVKENLYVFGIGDQKLPTDIYTRKLQLLHHYSLFRLQKDYFLTLKELEYEQFKKVS